ncbi:MAG: cytochrome P450 [Acidobacteriota bacterium]
MPPETSAQSLEPTAAQLLEPPGPPAPSRIFGHLKQFKHDALNTLTRAHRDYGEVAAFRLGPMQAFLLAHPDHVQQVLQSHHRNYDKRLPSYSRMKVLLGEGLLTSEGEHWRKHRRIAQPAFSRGRLVPFGEVMVGAAEELSPALTAAAASGEPIDTHVEMMRLTLQIASETLVGTDVRSEAAAIGSALNAVLEGFNDRLYRIFPLPEWVPTPANRRFFGAKRTLDQLVLEIIDARRRSSEPRDDLLGRLVSARDEETGEAMDDQQLRDEVMTLLMAGHETTANALTWTWLLLAQHPHVADRLRNELDEVLGGRTPQHDDLSRLPFTKAVIDESMRLYPPAWIVERRAIADDVVGDYRIPARSVVFASAWVTHRHPQFWDDPEAFRPERFLPDAPRLEHRFAYFPFGAGPRVCIGGSFALLEARLVLATLAQRFELALATGAAENLELDANITLRPKHGLRMTVRSLS